MLHRFIALALAALATLALATVALGGGWAQVTVDSGQVDPPAGEEATINLNVLQHGVTPVSWPTLTVVATDAASGTVVRTEARADGPEGSYVATIVFPTAGEWTLTFDSAELEMEGSIALSVAPPVAAVQPAVAATAAPASDLMLLLLVLVTLAVAVAIAGLVLRSRAASTDRRVSAGT